MPTEPDLGFIPQAKRGPFVAALEAATKFSLGQIGEAERTKAWNASWDAMEKGYASWVGKGDPTRWARILGALRDGKKTYEPDPKVKTPKKPKKKGFGK